MKMTKNIKTIRIHNIRALSHTPSFLSLGVSQRKAFWWCDDDVVDDDVDDKNLVVCGLVYIHLVQNMFVW